MKTAARMFSVALVAAVMSLSSLADARAGVSVRFGFGGYGHGGHYYGHRGFFGHRGHYYKPYRSGRHYYGYRRPYYGRHYYRRHYYGTPFASGYAVGSPNYYGHPRSYNRYYYRPNNRANYAPKPQYPNFGPPHPFWYGGGIGYYYVPQAYGPPAPK